MSEIAEYWWMFLLRGVFAVILGIFALTWPFATLSALITVFSIFAIVEGSISIIVGLVNAGKTLDWWVYLIEGLAGMVIGIFVLKWTGLSLFMFVYMVGLWALLTGVLKIVLSISYRAELDHLWLSVIVGVLAVVFGILILINPLPALIGLPIFIGIYALVEGIFTIVGAFKLRDLSE